MARSQRRRRSGTLPRRKLVWARTSTETTFATAAPFTPFQADLLAGFVARYGADPVGCTVARIRGYLQVTSTVTLTPVVVGIRTGTEGEVAATDFNPMAAGEYNDWMAYEPLLAGLAAREPFGDVGARMVDIKSMRKLEELDETLFLYAGTDLAAAGTVQLAFNLSVLLMLP